VLQRESFATILGHFLFVEKTDEKVEDRCAGRELC